MGNVTYNRYSFIIDGKPVILTGGEFHYFRIAPEQWEERIAMMRQGGCNLLSTYIPWNYHETERGKYNWEGDRDLGRLLKICSDLGMYVVAKPGPFIGAEWDFGGFPHWFLTEDFSIRVADEKYLEYTKNWFDEVAGIIKPYLITNGGKIILIQIENEYDHYLRGNPDLAEDMDKAREYLFSLLKFVRDAGIDIPAYTNDGSFVHGTEIINTSVYYPNVLGLWNWAFDTYDKQLFEFREAQPDKPLVTIETQSGWFLQTGTKDYDLELEASEAVFKSLTAYGISLINYYMYAGGTTVPFWGSIGDKHMGQRGVCTSYDFSGAPIREWGEIHKRFHIIKRSTYILESFPEILIGSEIDEKSIRIMPLNEEGIIVHNDEINSISAYTQAYENVTILLRRNENHAVLLIRNFEKDCKELRIEIDSAVLNKTITLTDSGIFKAKAEQTLLLPVDFMIDKENWIVYSTAEIILKKKLGDITYLFFCGYVGTEGEMLIKTNEELSKTQGHVQILPKDDNYLVRFDSSTINSFKFGDFQCIVLPYEETFKLWKNDNSIILSDYYYLENAKESKDGLEFNFQIKEDDGSSNIIWTDKEIKKITINNKDVEVSTIEGLNAYSFSYQIIDKPGCGVNWIGNWRYMSDSPEKEIDYDDSDFKNINSGLSLEKAGHFEHGYYWFRYDFYINGDINADASKIDLDLKTNGYDRYLVYVNGVLFQSSISPRKFSITDVIRSGKNTIAVLYANFAHTKGHPHEGPIKKVSGLYLPVTIEGIVNDMKFKKVVEGWKFRHGLNGEAANYPQPDFDDTAWAELPEKDKYIIEKDLGQVIWYRRVFNYKSDESWKSPVYINIEKMSDRGLIYVNGKIIGKYEDAGPQHRYYIPANILKEGENQVAITQEAPGFHVRYLMGFYPGIFKGPKVDFYYKARKVKLSADI